MQDRRERDERERAQKSLLNAGTDSCYRYRYNKLLRQYIIFQVENYKTTLPQQIWIQNATDNTAIGEFKVSIGSGSDKNWIVIGVFTAKKARFMGEVEKFDVGLLHPTIIEEMVKRGFDSYKLDIMDNSGSAEYTSFYSFRIFGVEL